MKKVSSANVAGKNRKALVVAAVMIILAIVLLSLPVYEFSATLYTKRSGNTFVGDERYVKAMQEVEAAAEEFRQQGHEVSISEQVTERVNSKGVTTSMVAFTVSSANAYNAWDFLGAGLPSSKVLAAILLCIAGAGVLALLGARSAMDVQHYSLAANVKRLRAAACWLALLRLRLCRCLRWSIRTASPVRYRCLRLAWAMKEQLR